MKNAAPQVSFYRQKVLLALLQVFGGSLANIDMQKYLFLFTRLCQKNRSYEFVPYRYGCFSFQSYADRRKLADIGVISADPDIWQLQSATDYLDMLGESDRKQLLLFREKYASITGERLVKEVYSRYPYFAIRSEIADKLMSKAQLAKIDSARPAQARRCFFTIGYEGKSFEYYLNQLIENNIRVLCDVRKNPLSRKYGFSKRVLSETVASLGILYIHLPELGITSEKRQDLKTLADYRRLFNDYETTTLRSNKDALLQLLVTVKEHRRIAITCFEAEECMCHRGRVAKALRKLPDWKYDIKHL